MTTLEVCTIDVDDDITKLEGDLEADRHSRRGREALGILRRWQHDEMLSVRCRRRARALVARYAPLR